MRRSAAENIGRTDLLQRRRHYVGALRLEPAQIELLAVDLYRAHRFTRTAAKCDGHNQRGRD
jgi:hypothetical protein